MVIPQSLIERIKGLTTIDLKYKTRVELWASASEEFGEIARELKIEEQIFGNDYKLPDEGVKGEAVDLFICAICLYFANKYNSPISELNLSDSSAQYWPLNKSSLFAKFHYASKYLFECLDDDKSAIKLAQYAVSLFFYKSGTEQEFVNYCNKKLDKWETSQNGTIQSRNMEIAS